MSNTAAPGWYRHPDDPTTEFWWDGAQYTQSRPAGTAVQPAYPQPAFGVAPVYYPGGVSPKSRTVAAILGFFLGGLGIHRFYLGNVGLGLGLLLAGWLTFGIWPLVDWIIVLAGGAHDGQGLPVVNWN